MTEEEEAFDFSEMQKEFAPVSVLGFLKQATRKEGKTFTSNLNKV
jgi:hypothetical protein